MGEGRSLYMATNLLNGEGKFKPSGRALLLRLKQGNFDCKMLIICPCLSSLEPLCSRHRSPWSSENGPHYLIGHHFIFILKTCFLERISFSLEIYFYFIHMGILPAHASVHRMLAVPTEASKGYQICWDWSYGWV